MTEINGMNTLPIPLDALEACSPRVPAENTVFAIGSTATHGIVRTMFRLEPRHADPEELLKASDEKLAAPSAVISVVRHCTSSHQVQPGEVARSGRDTPYWRFELVGSIVLAKNSPARLYRISEGDRGAPQISVESDGFGSAHTPELRRKTPYHILFMPFNKENPPTKIVEARTEPGATALFVALSTGVLLTTPESIKAAMQNGRS